MRTRKIFAVMATAAMCVSLITGFGGRSVAAADDEVTAENLINGFFETEEAYESSSFRMGMDMDVAMNLFGYVQNINMEITMDVQSFGGNTYMTGYMTSKTFEDGEDVVNEQEVEQYIIMNDGKYEVYSYNKESDAWSKSVSDTISISLDMIPKFDASKFNLEEEDDWYVVSGSIDILEMMEEMPDVIPDISQMFGGLGEISGEADITYRFDKETKELNSVMIDMARALQDMIDVSISEAVAALGETLGEDGEFDPATLFSAEFRSFNIEIEDIVLNQGSEIVLPDEVKEAASSGEEVEEVPADEEANEAPDGKATLPSGFAK